MGDHYDIVPVFPVTSIKDQLDCKDMHLLNSWLESLVLGMQQWTPSGGVHTHPAARLLMTAICLLINPKAAIETGPDAGLTTQALALGIRDGKLIAIENGTELSTNAMNRYNSVLPTFPNVQTLNYDALEALRILDECAVDFIFIDDDHSEEHVMLEMIEVRRVLTPGGVAVFHDVTYFPYIEKHIRKIFKGWDIMILPAPSPTQRTVDGVIDNLGDMGIGIVRKPS